MWRQRVKHKKEIANRLTRLLCVLALLFLGFAHKPPQIIGDLTVAEAAAYLLPDGTFPQICDESGDVAAQKGGHGPLHTASHCEACLISATSLLPPPPGVSPPVLREAERLLPLGFAQHGLTEFRLTAAPRGPPAFSLA